MARASSDKRMKLGEPWASKLTDYCLANYNCPQIEVIREALDHHIDERLRREPELKLRFEGARARRLGASGNVAVLPQKRSGN